MKPTRTERAASLIVIRGSDLGKRFEVTAKSTIGRSNSADFSQPDDEYMSRAHFSIEATDTGWLISNLSAVGGTKVDDEPVDGSTVIAWGVQADIAAGRTVFRLIDGRWPERDAQPDIIISPRKHDGLTRTLSKWWFCHRNDEFMSPEHPAVAIGLDIVNFSQVNDSFGHVVGDRVLRELGEMLMRVVGEAGFVVRTGGEEFVVVMPIDALEVGRDLGQTLAAIVHDSVFAFPPLTIGVRTGVVRREHGQPISDLLAVAVAAAKRTDASLS